MFELKPLPHREAIAYFQSKGYAPPEQSFDYRDTWRDDHARNWVVAKAVREDVSRTIREEMQRALDEGRTLAQFQADLAPRLQELGWWGRQAMQDPVTGETVDARLGSMRRLRVIFDTNMRTAHAAGHWASIERTKRAFPYLEYVQIDRPTKRQDHARFHGHIWPVDDPVWQRIYPPNGWFCGCHVIQRTEGWMVRHNRTVSQPLDLELKPWLNKRSGEIEQVPRGIAPGFDNNPGAAWLDIRAAWERVAADLPSEQRDIQKGLIEGLRQRRLNNAAESLVVTDNSSDPVTFRSAAKETPDRIPLGGIVFPPRASILHSHYSDASLSHDDVQVLFDNAGYAITAISPGGSIWRAVRGTELPRLPLLQFRAHAFSSFGQLQQMDQDEAAIVYQHAMMLWLEREGVIAYSFHVTDRIRQILAANASLLERLLP